MGIGSFLKLVEIQTKVASMIPLALGTVYSIYRFDRFNLKNFLFMLISLLSFDMATTAINNYMDYKKARKTSGFNYEDHNAIVKHGLREGTVQWVIFLLVGAATVLGVMLVFHSNILVLLLGMVSFIIGILYSFGPVPISRTPMGELFSGIFMGFIIVFISVYIHVFDEGIVLLDYINGIVTLRFDFMEILYVFLVSVPAIAGIANIMLANNICDMEDDLENRRYTLPIYIGKENALKVFKGLYYIAYGVVAFLLVLKVVPLSSFLTLLTGFAVYKNIQVFDRNQSKKDTFVLSVQNFALMNMVHVLTIGIGILF